VEITPVVLAVTAAAGNVLGAAVLARNLRRGLRAIETSLAFGAGFMLAVVILGVFPEVFARGSGAGLWVLGGYLLVHLAQHVVVPHFHFGEETHEITAAAGVSALIGLSLHSFFDGVAIASGFLASAGLGMILFLAVLLHKLPEGVAIASVVVAAGGRARQAVLAGAVLGGATMLGWLMTGRATALQDHGLPLAAGVTLYVAASNLVPEFQAKAGWVLPIAFFGGAMALVLIRVLIGPLP
jgi:ZIP family zinc transporter/zinc and cadmium transporter